MVAEVKKNKEVSGVFGVFAHRSFAFLSFLAAFLIITPSYAQDVNTVVNNVVFSSALIPGLISGVAYLIGVFFAVSGVLGLKSHVESPGEGSGQTPIRTPVIKLLAGGGMFALPIVFESMRNTFSGRDGLQNAGVVTQFNGSIVNDFANLGGADGNFNAILDNVILSITTLPGLITAVAYLLGTLLGVASIIKMKDHVENPSQVTLKEPVIRMLTAGALFAIPTIFSAMLVTIEGGAAGEFFASGSTSAAQRGINTSTYANGVNCEAGTNTTLGSVICGIRGNAGLFPAFLSALSYLFGLIMGIWGILKVRDHVLNPSQTNVFEGVSRFIAGGAFFALPALVEVFRNTLSSDALAENARDPVTSFNEATGGGTCGDITSLGLDGVLACAMDDVFAPIHLVMNLFTFVAGMIFIMIGISRLIKGAQDGARGPGGFGTIMSFIIGGALVSYNELMGAASATFLGDSQTKTFAKMNYLEGLTEVKPAAEAVIGAIIKFMIVIGLISFIRGLFIIRTVAEGGNQQTSMMAAVTHIIGGALAVNLGPLLNAIQETLGISEFGIAFGSS